MKSGEASVSSTSGFGTTQTFSSFPNRTASPLLLCLRLFIRCCVVAWLPTLPCRAIESVASPHLPALPLPPHPFPLRAMFFTSRALLGAKKLSAITSKRGNKNFYKGRGAKSLGYRTPHGQTSSRN